MKSTIQDYFLSLALLGTEEGKREWPQGGLMLNQRKTFSGFGVMNDRRALRKAVESVFHLRRNAFEDAGVWVCHVQRWLPSSVKLFPPWCSPLPGFFCLQLFLSFPFKPTCINFFVPSFRVVIFLLTILPQLLVSYSIMFNSSFWLPTLQNMPLLFMIFYSCKQFSLEPSLSCKYAWDLGPRPFPLPWLCSFLYTFWMYVISINPICPSRLSGITASSLKSSLTHPALLTSFPPYS